MVQGAGRPGQPNIFGNGGRPKFTQMPSYTPVTRAPGQPQAPYPPQTANPQPAPAQPAPVQRAPQALPPHPQPAAYQPQQPPQPQAFGVPHRNQPQAYTAPGPAAPGPGAQELPDLSDADPGFPDSIFGDFKAPESHLSDTDFSAAAPAPDQSFDAGFPEPADAEFPNGAQEIPAPASGEYAPGGSYGGGDEVGYGAHAGPQAFDPAQYTAPQAPTQQYPGYQPQSYQPQHGAPQVPYPQAQQPQQSAPGETGRQLQAFNSTYDQPPQIALGAGQGHAPVSQDFFEADRGDADFIDESQLAAQAGKGSKLMNSLKGRSAVMIASALLGAIALGGALAYAYKQSGGSGEAPIVTADASPVKEAPDQPGGKEFPHKNKLIYDRLTNGDQPGSERLVPRQEDVAVPALPPGSATAGLPASVATTDSPSEAGADGARKVNTFVVRPDGSVETPPPGAAADAAAGAAVQGAQDAAAAAGQAAQNAADAATQAATGAASEALGQPSNMMPVPAPQAAPQQMAAANPAPQAEPQQVATADPAAASPADDSKYVVQLGSSKSQTDALANFADAQQKYPSLLNTYQPIVRKTDLGDKGTWYRLQVGPMGDKSAAYKLCGELKAKGHADCLVMAQ